MPYDGEVGLLNEIPTLPTREAINQRLERIEARVRVLRELSAYLAAVRKADKADRLIADAEEVQA